MMDRFMKEMKEAGRSCMARTHREQLQDNYRFQTVYIVRVMQLDVYCRICVPLR